MSLYRKVLRIYIPCLQIPGAFRQQTLGQTLGYKFQGRFVISPRGVQGRGPLLTKTHRASATDERARAVRGMRRFAVIVVDVVIGCFRAQSDRASPAPQTTNQDSFAESFGMLRPYFLDPWVQDIPGFRVYPGPGQTQPFLLK